jgi:hypothetical protein
MQETCVGLNTNVAELGKVDYIHKLSIICDVDAPHGDMRDTQDLCFLAFR